MEVLKDKDGNVTGKIEVYADELTAIVNTAITIGVLDPDLMSRGLDIRKTNTLYVVSKCAYELAKDAEKYKDSDSKEWTRHVMSIIEKNIKEGLGYI